MRTVKPAKGTKGFIIRIFDSHVFRVYNERHEFIDYDITHHDLEVEILESDATFYHSEFGSYLDYAPIDESK
jgi:hypothetical protein